ncbi:hypothetical protein [Actinophytocola sp. NPDC049390]|uniref:hypothetical protein n=1 Tax=Actinophytocola sp. NPDC049390 TaxID=3363894 RepID=UPI003789C66A
MPPAAPFSRRRRTCPQWLAARFHAIAAIAGVALFGAAGPANAISSDTTGSNAYGNSDGDWKVYDTKCDGDSAYGRFIEKGTTGIQRKNNTSGCGSVASGDSREGQLRWLERVVINRS